VNQYQGRGIYAEKSSFSHQGVELRVHSEIHTRVAHDDCVDKLLLPDRNLSLQNMMALQFLKAQASVNHTLIARD